MPASQRLSAHKEDMSVSWDSTRGTLNDRKAATGWDPRQCGERVQRRPTCKDAKHDQTCATQEGCRPRAGRNNFDGRASSKQARGSMHMLLGIGFRMFTRIPIWPSCVVCLCFFCFFVARLSPMMAARAETPTWSAPPAAPPRPVPPLHSPGR